LGPFSTQGLTCACPYTQAKGLYTGCLVELPWVQEADKKETCITNKHWNILFSRWLQVASFPKKLTAVIAPVLTSNDFFSTCAATITDDTCNSFRGGCDAHVASLCNAKDVCECNNGRCLLDYGPLKDFKCLDYTGWIDEGKAVSDIPYPVSTYGSHLTYVVEDGSRRVDLPEYPSFAVGGVMCKRTLSDVCHKRKRCPFTSHSFCSSGACKCNINKCAYEGRCIDFHTWLYVVKKWAAIAGSS